MANNLATMSNLVLTAIFYSPLIPITIPIALVGLCFSYWVDKFNLLKVNRVPEVMNGVLAQFISNMIPYFTLLWALSYVLIFDEMIQKQEGERDIVRLIVPLATIGFNILFIILPFRTIINICSRDDNLLDADQKVNYSDIFHRFTYDYDRENPVTKREGFLRIM